LPDHRCVLSRQSRYILHATATLTRAAKELISKRSFTHIRACHGLGSCKNGSDERKVAVRTAALCRGDAALLGAAMHRTQLPQLGWQRAVLSAVAGAAAWPERPHPRPSRSRAFRAAGGSG